MKRMSLCIVAFIGLLTSYSVAQTNQVERLLNEYAAVKALTCDVRRSVQTDGKSVTFLSRVFFQAGDRLHVQNIQPLPRRIVCDGSNFFSYIDGDAKGFSRPVTTLPEEMLLSLRRVPGTAMDHLLRLKGLPEEPLPATNGASSRVGYQTKAGYLTLEFDASNLLTDIRFFESREQVLQSAHYHYERFEEPIPGVAIPTLHEAEVTIKGITTHETTHIDHLTVNQPIADSLFIPATFFQGVSFADNFADTLAAP